MPPAHFGGELFFCVGRVVDNEIGTLDKIEDVLVRLAGYVLGISDVAVGVFVVLNSICGSDVRMIERRRPHSYVRADHELIAGFEIFEVQIRLHRLKRDRKCRLRHLPSEDTTNAIIAQVARHDAKLVAWGEARTKERKPDRKSTRLNSSHVKISYAI